MGQEFDSSAYELASDYAYHLKITKNITEAESIALASTIYGLTYNELTAYCKSFS